ncbi:MAG: hypothetical protein QOE90_92 [Thermoplasmata archaeon]|jgi:N-acetylneuraminic acid mutarotase|nr:hypothetical protein [Thermoplasmata archaeon]
MYARLARSRFAILLLVASLLAPATPWTVSGAAARSATDATVPLAGTMPTARYGSSAVWDGAGHAYVFGGYDGNASAQILRYDAANDSYTVMGAALPTGIYESAAVWDGAGHAYIFGGLTSTVSYNSKILRYTPANDTLLVMHAYVSRISPSAVWDGVGNAYLFGGFENGPLTQIVRFTPATDTLITLSATLPTPNFDASAVWSPAGAAYVFGGSDNYNKSTAIVRFVPSTGAVSTMAARLPVAVMQTAAVWDAASDRAYVIGGDSNTANRQNILAYDPVADSISISGAKLPGARIQSAAVWDGLGSAYVFGGRTGTNPPPYYANATRFDAALRAPSVGGRLPAPLTSTSAIWDGRHAYIFGGATSAGDTNQILQYDPVTNTTTVMSSVLPTARHCTSAIWDGRYAYVFGGYPRSTSEILRYDTSTDTLTTLPDTFPTPRSCTSAVWNGTDTFVFGGADTGPGGSTRVLSDILLFNDTTETAQLLPTRLPSPRQLTSAFFDGTRAWVVGGKAADGSEFSEITGMDPVAGVSTRTQAWLPDAVSGAPTVWDHQNAYTMGSHAAARRTEIVQTDPATTQTLVVDATLPGPRDGASSVWNGTLGFVFGGQDPTTGLLLDQIVPFRPPLEAPRVLAACTQSDGQTSLLWAPPANDGGSPVSAYNIYRGGSAQSEALYTTDASATPRAFDANAVSGTTYYYQVAALDALGHEGPRSNVALSTAPRVVDPTVTDPGPNPVTPAVSNAGAPNPCVPDSAAPPHTGSAWDGPFVSDLSTLQVQRFDAFWGAHLQDAAWFQSYLTTPGIPADVPRDTLLDQPALTRQMLTQSVFDAAWRANATFRVALLGEDAATQAQDLDQTRTMLMTAIFDKDALVSQLRSSLDPANAPLPALPTDASATSNVSTVLDGLRNATLPAVPAPDTPLDPPNATTVTPDDLAATVMGSLDPGATGDAPAAESIATLDPGAPAPTDVPQDIPDVASPPAIPATLAADATPAPDAPEPTEAPADVASTPEAPSPPALPTPGATTPSAAAPPTGPAAPALVTDLANRAAVTIASTMYQLCWESSAVPLTCAQPAPIGTAMPYDVTGDGVPDGNGTFTTSVDPAYPTGYSGQLVVARDPAANALAAHVLAIVQIPGTTLRGAIGFDARESALSATSTLQATITDVTSAVAGDVHVVSRVTYDAPASPQTITARFEQITPTCAGCSTFTTADPIVGTVRFETAPASFTNDIVFLSNAQGASFNLTTHLPAATNVDFTLASDVTSEGSRTVTHVRAEALPATSTVNVSRFADGSGSTFYAGSASIAKASVHVNRTSDLSKPGTYAYFRADVQGVPTAFSLNMTPMGVLHYQAASGIPRLDARTETVRDNATQTRASVTVLGLPSVITLNASAVPGAASLTYDANAATPQANVSWESLVAPVTVANVAITGLSTHVDLRAQGTSYVSAAASPPISLLVGNLSVGGAPIPTLPGDHASLVSTGANVLGASWRVASFSRLLVDQTTPGRLAVGLSAGAGQPFLAHASTPSLLVDVNVSALPSSLDVVSTATSLHYDASAIVPRVLLHATRPGDVADVDVTSLPANVDLGWTLARSGTLTYSASSVMPKLSVALNHAGSLVALSIRNLSTSLSVTYDADAPRASLVASPAIGLVDGSVSVGGATVAGLQGTDYLVVLQGAGTFAARFAVAGVAELSGSGVGGGAAHATLWPGGQPFFARVTTPAAFVELNVSALPRSFNASFASGAFHYDATSVIPRLRGHALIAGTTADLDVYGLPAVISATWSTGRAGSFTYSASSVTPRVVLSLNGGTTAVALTALGVSSQANLAYDADAPSLDFLATPALGTADGYVQLGGLTVGGVAGRDHVVVRRNGTAFAARFNVSGVAQASATGANGGAFHVRLSPGGQPFTGLAFLDPGVTASVVLAAAPTDASLDLRPATRTFSYAGVATGSSATVDYQDASSGLVAHVAAAGLPSSASVSWTATSPYGATYDASGSLGSLSLLYRASSTGLALSADASSLPPWMQARLGPAFGSFDARTSSGGAPASASVGSARVRFGTDGAYLNGTPASDHAWLQSTANASRGDLLVTGLKSAFVDATGVVKVVSAASTSARPFAADVSTPTLALHAAVDAVPASLNATYAPGAVSYRANAVVGNLSLLFTDKTTTKVNLTASALPPSFDATWNGAAAKLNYSASAPMGQLYLQVSVANGTTGTTQGDHAYLVKRGAAFGLDARVSGVQRAAIDPTSGGWYDLLLSPGGRPFAAHVDLDASVLGDLTMSAMPTSATVHVDATTGGFAYAGTAGASLGASYVNLGSGRAINVSVPALPATIALTWVKAPNAQVTYDASGPISWAHAFYQDGTNLDTFDVTASGVPPHMQAAWGDGYGTFDARASSTAPPASASVGFVAARYSSNGRLLTGTTGTDHLVLLKNTTTTRAEMQQGAVSGLSFDTRNDRLAASLSVSSPRAFSAVVDVPKAYVSTYVASLPAGMSLSYDGTLLSVQSSSSIPWANLTYFPHDGSGKLISAIGTGLPTSVNVTLATGAGHVDYAASGPASSLSLYARMVSGGRTWTASLALTGLPAAWNVAWATDRYNLTVPSGTIGSFSGWLTNGPSPLTFGGQFAAVYGRWPSGDFWLSASISGLGTSGFERAPGGFDFASKQAPGSVVFVYGDFVDNAQQAYVTGWVVGAPSSLSVGMNSGTNLWYKSSSPYTAQLSADVGSVSGVAAAPAAPYGSSFVIRDGDGCPGSTPSCLGWRMRLGIAGMPVQGDANLTLNTYNLTGFGAWQSQLSFDVGLAKTLGAKALWLKGYFLGIPSGLDIRAGPFLLSGQTNVANGLSAKYWASGSIGQLWVDGSYGSIYGTAVLVGIPSSFSLDGYFTKSMNWVNITSSASIPQVNTMFRPGPGQRYFGGASLFDTPTSMRLNYTQLPEVFSSSTSSTTRDCNGQSTTTTATSTQTQTEPSFAYQANADTLSGSMWIDAAFFGGDLNVQGSLSFDRLARTTSASYASSMLTFSSSPVPTKRIEAHAAAQLSMSFPAVTLRGSGCYRLELTFGASIPNARVDDLGLRLRDVSNLNVHVGFPIRVSGTFSGFDTWWQGLHVPLNADASLNLVLQWRIFPTTTIPLVGVHPRIATLSSLETTVAGAHMGNLVSIPTSVFCWGLPPWYKVDVSTNPHLHSYWINGASMGSPAGEGGAWEVMPDPNFLFGPVVDTILAAFLQNGASGVSVNLRC